MASTWRVFCTKLSGIYPRKLLESLQSGKGKCHVVDSELDFDFESPRWEKMQILCESGRGPITIEHYISGVHGSTVEEEASRLMRAVEELGESWGKREVTVYLRMSRELFILRCEGASDQQMKETITRCATTLAQYGEGTVQVDGDGFYKKGQLVLPLTQE